MNSTTIKPNELVANLEVLRGKIARKPADYVPRKEHPKSINESFSSYTRTRHVNGILAFSDGLRELFGGWPFPFFMLSSFQNRYWVLTVGIPLTAWLYLIMGLELLRSRLEVLRNRSTENESRHQAMMRIVEKGMVKMVRLSCGELFSRWKSQEILANHQQELYEIRAVYRKGYCYPCVTATFPVLDHVCRKLLRTENLGKGVGHIIKVFEEANINLESLRPGHGAWDYAEKIGVSARELSDQDLRLVGVALESFLRFAKEYYGHTTSDQNASVLNRHAVLHGARGRVWTRGDATKLLLFLDLMLILVPTFEILLATNEQSENQGTRESRKNS